MPSRCHAPAKAQPHDHRGAGTQIAVAYDLETSHAERTCMAAALAFASLLAALVTGVFGHHLITSGQEAWGTAAEIGGGILALLAAFAAAVRSRHGSQSSRITGALLLFVLAWVYFDSLEVSDFPIAVRVAWGLFGVGSAFLTLRMFAVTAVKEPSRNAPAHGANTTPARALAHVLGLIGASLVTVWFLYLAAFHWWVGGSPAATPEWHASWALIFLLCSVGSMGVVIWLIARPFRRR